MPQLDFFLGAPLFELTIISFFFFYLFCVTSIIFPIALSSKFYSYFPIYIISIIYKYLAILIKQLQNFFIFLCLLSHEFELIDLFYYLTKISFMQIFDISRHNEINLFFRLNHSVCVNVSSA